MELNLIQIFPEEIYPLVLSKLRPTVDFNPLSISCKFFHKLIINDPKFILFNELVSDNTVKDYLCGNSTRLIQRLFAYVQDSKKHIAKNRKRFFSNMGRNQPSNMGRNQPSAKGKKSAGTKYDINSGISISWWEFLFHAACELSNNIAIDLLLDHPIIQLYQQNIHVGFVVACEDGSASLVKELYIYGKTIGVDLYYYHLCTHKNNLFCNKPHCSCEYDKIKPINNEG